MASRRAISSWKTSSPCFISVTRSPRRSASSLVTRSARPSSCWIDSSRVAMAREMPREAGERRLDVRAGGVDGVAERRQRLGEPRDVDRLGGGGQLAERGDDVVAAVRAADRDGVTLIHLAAALGRQLEVLLAQQVQHLHRGLGLVAQLGVLDVDVHGDVVPGDVDPVDPADADPGDLHHVALVQAARVGELHVVVGALEARELLQVEGSCHHHQQHDEAHRAQPEDRPFVCAAPSGITPLGVAVEGDVGQLRPGSARPGR